VKRDDETGLQKIFLIREVKGATKDGSQPKYGAEEGRKILCAHAHFGKAFGGDVDYRVIANPSDL